MESFHTSSSTRWETGWRTGWCGGELALQATENGKVSSSLPGEMPCLGNKSREKQLLVGNYSLGPAIQNTLVPFLFFWESRQTDLESPQVVSGVAYCFVQRNGKSRHRTLREVSQRLMREPEWFLLPVTLYWGISQRNLLQWSDLLPHLLGWDHCDFSSCICSTRIYGERGMQILE